MTNQRTFAGLYPFSFRIFLFAKAYPASLFFLLVLVRGSDHGLWQGLVFFLYNLSRGG
jgi:hypothetical protein